MHVIIIVTVLYFTNLINSSASLVQFDNEQTIRTKLSTILDSKIVERCWMPRILGNNVLSIQNTINVIYLEELGLRETNLSKYLIKQYTLNKRNIALILMNYDPDLEYELKLCLKINAATVRQQSIKKSKKKAHNQKQL